MYYVGATDGGESGIGRAVSGDGLAWTRQPATPLQGLPQRKSTAKVDQPDCTQRGDKLDKWAKGRHHAQGTEHRVAVAVDVLADEGIGVHLAHPLGIKGFENRRVKNDLQDAEMLANLLTKPLPRDRHERLVGELGLATIQGGVLEIE